MKIADDLNPMDLKQSGGSKKITATENDVLHFLEVADSRKAARDRVLSSGELEDKFTDANYERNDLVKLRDSLEKSGKITVLRNLPRNQILTGLPDASKSYLEWSEKQKARDRKKK